MRCWNCVHGSLLSNCLALSDHVADRKPVRVLSIHCGCGSQGGEDAKQESAARTYSMSSEGHAADKAALQGFGKTRDAASSPARPAVDQQPSRVGVIRIYA